MTRLLTSIFSLILLGTLFSCDKGNFYYEEYQNEIKTFEGNTYQYLESNKGVFDSLLLVLDRVFPLQDTLRNQEITLFAPTNDSFTIALQNLNTQRKLVNKTPVYLEDITRAELDTLVSKYIFKEIITTESIRGMKDGVYKYAVNNGYKMHVKYNVLNASGYVGGGQQQIIFTDPNYSIFERYWDKTTTNSVNIYTSNGVVHILTPAHDFGFGKLGNYTN